MNHYHCISKFTVHAALGFLILLWDILRSYEFEQGTSKAENKSRIFLLKYGIPECVFTEIIGRNADINKIPQ